MTEVEQKGLGLSQNTKQGFSAVSRKALFFQCGYTPDLLATLQENPGQPTPFFASVAIGENNRENIADSSLDTK